MPFPIFIVHHPFASPFPPSCCSNSTTHHCLVFTPFSSSCRSLILSTSSHPHSFYLYSFSLSLFAAACCSSLSLPLSLPLSLSFSLPPSFLLSSLSHPCPNLIPSAFFAPSRLWTMSATSIVDPHPHHRYIPSFVHIPQRLPCPQPLRTRFSPTPSSTSSPTCRLCTIPHIRHARMPLITSPRRTPSPYHETTTCLPKCPACSIAVPSVTSI